MSDGSDPSRPVGSTTEHDGHTFVKVSTEAFETWLSQPVDPPMSRAVSMIYEPPLETITRGDSLLGMSKLMSPYPALGIEDPRPEGDRPNWWWRVDCYLRSDVVEEKR